MTVRELIEHLQTIPQDFPIVYRCCSDWSELDVEDIGVQRSTDKLTYSTAIVHHNMIGGYRNYRGEHEYKGLPLPSPANVVTFPGN